MLLNFKELQKELKLGNNKTLKWCHQADTPAFRIGKKWYCRKDSLDQWLREQEAKQKRA